MYEAAPRFARVGRTAGGSPNRLRIRKNTGGGVSVISR